ncbi:hypothetical protein QCA50_010744 [Cerrena zonata]|uniref:Uncharacterized protein n=1 Tax=Cerrena zonata TaxID=2478898 RepID=A0AAW0FXJ3_9APHY
MTFLGNLQGPFLYFALTHPVHTLPAETKALVMTFCDLSDLIGLSYDSHWAQLAAREIRASFLYTLAKFSPDAFAFREMMRVTNTIITGATALHYLLRQPYNWESCEIDLIVCPAYIVDVTRFIMAFPGATRTSEFGLDGVDDYIQNDFGIGSTTTITTTMASFKLVLSSEMSPFHLLAHYWSTHVMNALTADSLVCAYPTLTLQRKGIISYIPMLSEGDDIIDMWKGRGLALCRSRQQL